MVVVGHRRRHVHAFPTAYACAPCEVDILEVQEEARVEAAELVEHSSAHQRRTRAGTEDRRWNLVAFGGKTTDMAFERDAKPVNPKSRRIDATVGCKPYLRRQGPHAGMTLSHLEQLSYRGGIERRIVVQQEQPVTACRLDAGVGRRRKAAVLGQLEQLCLGMGRTQRSGSAVLRPVVDHEDLARAMNSRECRVQRSDAGEQQFSSVEVDDDGAQEH